MYLKYAKIIFITKTILDLNSLFHCRREHPKTVWRYGERGRGGRLDATYLV